MDKSIEAVAWLITFKGSPPRYLYKADGWNIDTIATIPSLLSALASVAVECEHPRQKWSVDMQSGHCEDCGAKFGQANQ